MKPESDMNNQVKEEIKKFWDDRSRTFDEDLGHGIAEEESQMWKDHFLKIFGKKHLSVLDIGTGTGSIALELAGIGHDVIGIDLSTLMLQKAREKAKQKNFACSFISGDAESPEFEENQFDLIISRHLLWTLPDPIRALSEWKRITKPGGTIMVIDGHRQRDIPFQVMNIHEHPQKKPFYSKKLLDQLYFSPVVSVEEISDFFKQHSLVDVQDTSFSDIGELHRKLAEITGQPSHHHEVNVIWGVVRK